MSKNRLIAIFAVLVLLVAAVFTIGSGIAPAPSMPNRGVANKVAGRHPELVYSRTNVEPIALDTAGAPDWFQRHPDSLNPGNAVDLTDYYARHPGASIALNMAVSADWFQRHPESLKAGNAMDLTDYYARHQGATIALNAVGDADWFQRHPESLNPGNAVDLTDYYARHPGKEQDDLATRRP